MLDIKFIRQNPDKIKKACQDKQVKVDIGRLLEIDEKRLKNLQALEDMRAQKNKASKEIAKALNQKEKQKIILKMQELDRNNDRLDKTLKSLEKEFNELMLQIPNPSLKGVPPGKDESENVVVKKVGKVPQFDFESKDYLEIAEHLDLIDMKRAAKTSGSRFGFLKKEAALMEFALVNFVFDELIKEKFIPIIPPALIKPDMMQGMGYLERGKEDMYFIEKDKLYLVGTAEQIIGPMYAGETFDKEELPKRYIAFSPCFRREAGSYGRDTRGILRVHQFDKAEMFVFSKPENSEKEHQHLLSLEEKFMQALKIPYQVVQMCTGDLGDPAASKYDIEAWIPSENKYRETHSTSNCTDFQARRLDIRYKDKENKLKFVHTLNGTALAMGRTLIAITENYQQKDGSIKVPQVLQKYLSFKEIKKPKGA